MSSHSDSSRDELINPYLPFADLMVNFVLILILFAVALSVSIGLGSGEVYKKEQAKLLATLQKELGRDVFTPLNDRNDPGGAQRFSFSGEYLFEPGTVKISARAKVTLTALAKVLSQPEFMRLYRRIRIEGHTRPSTNNAKEFNNWRLSTDMAISVADILNVDGGISANSLTVSGRGGQAPVDLFISGTSKRNPAFDEKDPKHVRVEIVLEYAELSATGQRTRAQP